MNSNGSNDDGDSDNGGGVYLVTGANSGVGLEATRQLLIGHKKNKVFMLCRSKERANSAISTQLGNPTNVEFIEFDATNDKKATIILRDDDIMIDGILMNAGGFGDGKTDAECSEGGASKIADLNLLGHVALIKNLIKEKKLKKGCRIVASGSEACFTIPKKDWYTADYAQHLQGKAVNTIFMYSWIKGIVALYWSAFARHYPQYYVTTVSPGSMENTGFYNQKGVTGIVTFASRIATMVNGNHSLKEGAERYLDSLLSTDDNGSYLSNEKNSGTFLAHRKGYTKDFGDVTKDPKGTHFGDTKIQNLVFDAVEGILL